METVYQSPVTAGLLAEARIVAAARDVRAEMARLIAGPGFAITRRTQGVARRDAEGLALCSRGMHPAPLNFCDCCARQAAQYDGCPLLYIGNDFAKTDIARAL